MIKLEGINRRVINPYSSPNVDEYLSRDIAGIYIRKFRISYVTDARIKNTILKITKEIF